MAATCFLDKGMKCKFLFGYLTLLTLVTMVTAFDTIINVGVLSTLDDSPADLYSTIADALLQEEDDAYVKKLLGDSGNNNASSSSSIPSNNVNSIDSAGAFLGSIGALLSKPNYCQLNFEPIIYNTTNSQSVYKSLKKARKSFESTRLAVAIGPFTKIFASTDYVIVNQLHMLTSSSGVEWDMLDPSKVMSILPEPITIAMVIEAVVKRFGWTDVALLAQDDFSPILNRLGQSSVSVWPIRLPAFGGDSDANELRRNLLSLRESEQTKFILHSYSRDIVNNVLQVARGLHLLHHSKQWLLTYPDFNDVVGRPSHGEGWPGSIYGIQILEEDKLPKNLTGLMAPGTSRLDLGVAVDVVGLLRHVLSNEAMDCTRQRSRDDVIVNPEAFAWQLKNKSDPYLGVLGRYAWNKDTNRRTELTIDVMESNSEISKLGSLYLENDVLNVSIPEMAFNDSFSRKAKLFDKNDLLRVATKLVDPFVIKEGDRYTGFSVDLMDMLAWKLNFSYELVEVKDVQTKAGQVNGMVHALTTGKANMAAGALEATADREKVISFSYTILSSEVSILIRKADSTIDSFQFLGPFSTELWIMILVFIMVVSLSLYGMSRYDSTQEGNEQRFDLKESLWYGFNVVLQGTTDYSPSTTSMRAIIAFFWFCVLVIDAAYTANLAAYLTLQQFDDRIKNIRDLAAQTKLVYAVEKDSDVMNYFQTKREDPFEHMWAFMKLHESKALLTNKTEIIQKVREGTLAFISDEVTNHYYANQYCGIESIEQNFGSKDFSLGFPRGTPYLDDINQALLELKEEGVFDQLMNNWLAMGVKCKDDDDTRSISQKTTAELELSNMVGVFIVLGFFIVLAVMVDIACRMYTRQKDKKDTPKDTVEMDETEGHFKGVEESINHD